MTASFICCWGEAGFKVPAAPRVAGMSAQGAAE